MHRFFLFTLLLIGVFSTFSGCNKDESCINCPPTQLDTTSHLIQWQPPDTLGAQGIIRDVWVFDRNNAWAVGEIYLNDSTGKLDMENPYNAAHWDGNEWELKRIESIICGSNSYVVRELFALFVFTENDIWYSDGAEIIHWNGQNHYQDCRMNSLLSGSIKKIWGTSGNNLFAIGSKGTIVYYNGTSWTKMASNTTVDLQDIWGIDANHIWATGTNTSDGHCVILQFNGTAWSTVYDNANVPPNDIHGFYTVWSYNINEIFLAGQSWIQSMNLNDGSFKILSSLSYYEAMRIRGVNQNDIFQVGYGSEVLHYNGVSWYKYPELSSLNGGNAWFYSVHPTKDFVAIGGLCLTQLNSFPVVIRGYR